MAFGAAAQGRPASPAGPATQAAPAEPAYEDRLIEGLEPLPAGEREDEPAYDREGWPRFLRLETRLGTRPFDERKRSSGASASGAIETPNHGVLSVDASLAREDRRSAVTLRQRGLPMGEGWTVNNEAGVITPLAPGIMRLASRVFVPSAFLRGAGTEWSDAASRTQWMASSGEPGRLQGFPVAGFRPLAGTVTTAGAQGAVGNWTAAARHARADGVTRFDDPARPSDFVDSDSTHVALRHEAGGHFVQANAVQTRSSETGDARRGVWVDGEWRASGATHGWGFFRLDPQLAWAGQSMASDVEGAYVRGAWRTRRWSAESSVDVLRSVSGSGDTGVFATASGRWRYSRWLTWGAGGSLRRFNGTAGSAFADARWTHERGVTGLRADFTRGFGERTARVSLDHGWALPLGGNLNTTLLAGRESGPGRSETLWGAAASVSAPLASELTLNGNAGTERRSDGSHVSSANLSLAWRLSPHWTLEGNLIQSLGRQVELRPLDPLAPLPERLATATDSRMFFLLLRYEDQAGSRTVPLGGTSQGGGGRLEGVVFLDANRNGTQEAGEPGAAGVTVHLDGRYAARTDSQGRFEFPFVAPGARAVTVLNETLPLPWEAGERSRVRVEVQVRESVRVLIPVVRRGAD